MIFDTPNHLVTGLSVFVLAGSGAVAQLVFGRTRALAGRRAGSLALSVGMLMIVLSAAEDSPRAADVGAVSAAPASASRSSARCARCRWRSRTSTARR